MWVLYSGVLKDNIAAYLSANGIKLGMGDRDWGESVYTFLES